MGAAARDGEFVETQVGIERAVWVNSGEHGAGREVDSRWQRVKRTKFEKYIRTFRTERASSTRRH